jgi:hypothetical protein
MRNLSFQKLQQEGRLLCNAVEIGTTRPTSGYCAEIQTVMPGSTLAGYGSKAADYADLRYVRFSLNS